MIDSLTSRRQPADINNSRYSGLSLPYNTKYVTKINYNKIRRKQNSKIKPSLSLKKKTCPKNVLVIIFFQFLMYFVPSSPNTFYFFPYF